MATAASAPIAFDVRVAPLSRDGGGLRSGVANPEGHVLDANRWHLTIDGEPHPIVSAELLPQRYPVAEWEDAVRAIRDAGCTTVSSYVFWGLIEPEPGRFDFSGANDIRRFAEICASFGLSFLPRIGPFNNSEYLVGGLPPWLFGMPVVERSNDPGYLRLVRRYFAAVAEQLDGMYVADGGPIEIVQLENELSHAPNDWSTLFGYTAAEHRGPTGEEFTAHMSALRAIALDAGIAPAFFSMTGWGNAGAVPDGEFLPTYGGYMDLHHRPGPNFRMTTFAPGDYPYRGRYPVAFCELGTGSPHRAAYRSRTPADMTVTTAMTPMGSTESIHLGYYLFHGGTNPVRGDGFGWTPKEPSFTLRSYDFWAPVSEFGERRDAFYALAPVNHLIREFGRDLAHLPVVDPNDPVRMPDEDRLRAVARGAGERGFVFLSNFGNNTALSPRTDVRLIVRRTGDEISVPRHVRLDVRSGANIVMPFGLDLGAGLTLVSSTTQPVVRLGTPRRPVIVFAAAQDEAEYVIADVTVDQVKAPASALVRPEPDGVSVVVPAGESFSLAGAASEARIITLTWSEAERSQIVGSGADRMLVTSADHFTTDASTATVWRLRMLGEADAAESSLRVVSADGDEVVPVTMPAPVDRGALQIDALSPSRALVRAADIGDESVADLWADIAYSGDLCRIFNASTGILEADDFRSGPSWRVKVGRFADALRRDGLQVRVEPVATKEAVDDPDGLLLDSAMRTDGIAQIDGIEFFQCVRRSVALR